MKLAVPLLVALAFDSSQALAGPISLATAQSFAVLGHSTVTNTGSTTIQGDLGLYSGPSVVGFAIPPANTVVEGPGSTGLIAGPGLVTGTIRIRDPIAQGAQNDSTTAYNTLAALAFTANLTGQVLGNGVGGTVPTLTPGIYFFSDTAQLNGALTLDFGVTPDALFVFQIGSALTTASASAVNVLHGGTNSGVYWVMGVIGGSGTGSATLGATTVFAGNILALDSITLNTSAKILCGRAIALNAAVTMDTNTISNDCNAANGGTDRSDFGSNGFSGSGTSNGSGGTVPEPATLALLGLGLVGLGFSRRRHG